MTDLKLLVLEYAASEALRPYEKAAHKAATDGDEVRYREALRAY
jgi:hypothetical protein